MRNGVLGVERVSLPLGGHVLNLDAGDGVFLRNVFGVLDCGVLGLILLHLLMHDGLRFLDDLLQEHNCTLPGTHSMDETKVYVFKTVSPRELQELQDFEELCGVKVLRGGDDIDHLVEFVFLVSLYSTGNVASEVD